MTFVDTMGWIGSVALLICSLPQAVKSVKQGHSEGLSPLMLWLWLIGMVAMLIYFIPLQLWPPVISYAFNLFVASVIIWFYYFPSARTQKIQRWK